MTNRKLSIKINTFTEMTIIRRSILSPHSIFSVWILIPIGIHLKNNIPIEIHKTNHIFFIIWIIRSISIFSWLIIISCFIVFSRISNIVKNFMNKLTTSCWSNPFSCMNSTFDKNLGFITKMIFISDMKTNNISAFFSFTNFKNFCIEIMFTGYVINPCFKFIVIFLQNELNEFHLITRGYNFGDVGWVISSWWSARIWKSADSKVFQNCLNEWYVRLSSDLCESWPKYSLYAIVDISWDVLFLELCFCLLRFSSR